MADFIEGYIYDIFVNYHQQNNKRDRWVIEFVDALLRAKLKYLFFIPKISQTFSDLKISQELHQ